MMKKTYELEWGIFSLIEFIASNSENIGNIYKTALDIGSGNGIQTEIMRHAGLEVFQLDKYSEKADYTVDFLEQNFEQKFDVIYCSHVIEHQRNVGFFLDKIYDCLSDNGRLIITAPKHPANRMIEGHLNCFVLTYFIQQLIHAGFDLSAGKLLSCNIIENAAIVPKANNFSIDERLESGYSWTEKHQQRSPIQLKNLTIDDEQWIFNNCEILSISETGNLKINLPKAYQERGIHISAPRWSFEVNI